VDSPATAAPSVVDGPAALALDVFNCWMSDSARAVFSAYSASWEISSASLRTSFFTRLLSSPCGAVNQRGHGHRDRRMPFGRLQRGLRIENHHLGLLRPAVVDRGQDDGHFGVFIDVRRQLSGRVEQLRSRPTACTSFRLRSDFASGACTESLNSDTVIPPAQTGAAARAASAAHSSAAARKAEQKIVLPLIGSMANGPGPALRARIESQPRGLRAGFEPGDWFRNAWHRVVSPWLQLAPGGHSRRATIRTLEGLPHVGATTHRVRQATGMMGAGGGLAAAPASGRTPGLLPTG